MQEHILSVLNWCIQRHIVPLLNFHLSETNLPTGLYLLSENLVFSPFLLFTLWPQAEETVLITRP